jgi:hypothetical protein
VCLTPTSDPGTEVPGFFYAARRSHRVTSAGKPSRNPKKCLIPDDFEDKIQRSSAGSSGLQYKKSGILEQRNFRF